MISIYLFSSYFSVFWGVIIFLLFNYFQFHYFMAFSKNWFLLFSNSEFNYYIFLFYVLIVFIFDLFEWTFFFYLISRLIFLFIYIIFFCHLLNWLIFTLFDVFIDLFFFDLPFHLFTSTRCWSFFFWHMMAKFVKCLQALSETPEDYEALVRTPKPPQPHSFCALLLLLHDWQWRLPTHCPQGLLGNRKRIRGFPFLCCMSFFFSFFSLPGHSLAFHAKDDQDLFLSLTARMIDHLPIGRWMKCWWSCHRCSGWHWAWVLPYRADFSHLGNNFHCLSSALSSSSFHTI